ncbi:MAG TPA: 50S ribosomal protein L9 [Bdellovibrionota bacterium]|nr:50S ribosomal protein L9 [Bdellovibrionota bacterium]
MKVVLLESVANLGVVGDVVNVRPGYARNLLLPKKKALMANSRNLKHVGHQKMVLDHKLKRVREQSEEVRKTLEGKGVSIRKKAGEHGKLFGSVTTSDVEEALRAAGVIVHRKFIHLDEPIKNTGKYDVPVKLDGGLEAKIKVEVVAEEK